jgi:hypothetical protein
MRIVMRTADPHRGITPSAYLPLWVGLQADFDMNPVGLKADPHKQPGLKADPHKSPALKGDPQVTRR